MLKKPEPAKKPAPEKTEADAEPKADVEAGEVEGSAEPVSEPTAPAPTSQIHTRPSVGRIVHYVYAPSDLGASHQHKAGAHRPAIVVEAGPPGSGIVNLQVFTDQNNDGFGSTLWKTSAHQSDEAIPGTWHWPEREG